MEIRILNNKTVIDNPVPEGKGLDLEVWHNGSACVTLSVAPDGTPSVYWREDFPAYAKHTSVSFYARKGTEG